MEAPSKYTPGFGTEYVENFCWSKEHDGSTTRTKEDSGLFSGPTGDFLVGARTPSVPMMPKANTEFRSTEYPNVYREVALRKDDRGKYTNPYKDYAGKEYGRRLLYDPDHPDKMYASQCSSELADPAGPYSFPTTTELPAEVPWTKNMVWKEEGQEGAWPTEQWRQWTTVAMCPPYNGHSDQLEYNKFKTSVP